MMVLVGGCYESGSCPDAVEPVCGVDGATYTNRCEARRAGVRVMSEGRCREEPPPPCACVDIEAPVCGVDGLTYGNECEARCVGVGIDWGRRCECAALSCEAICPDGFTVATVRGCPSCECLPTPRRTCTSDPDCRMGEQCVEEPSTGCFGSRPAAGFDAGPAPCFSEWVCKPVECPPVTCDRLCLYGFARDTFGCETCECLIPACLDDSACLPEDHCPLPGCEPDPFCSADTPETCPCHGFCEPRPADDGPDAG